MPHVVSLPWLSRAVLGAAFIDLLLIAVLLWPGAVGEASRQPLRIGVALLTAALSVALLTLLRRLRDALARAEAAARRERALFDAVPAALSLWSADGRLLDFNPQFRALHEKPTRPLTPGMTLESLLRLSIDAGDVPAAKGREPAWLAERLRRFDTPGEPQIRQRADGRWRRLIEIRLPDGNVLGHSVDITEVVEQGRALDAARRDAEQARQRLQDAFDAMPAALELYDADDRLVLTNQAMRELYPQLVDMEPAQPTFEQLLRANFARGGLAIEPSRFEGWLAERLASRRAGGPGELARIQGRWFRRLERRTREGGTIGARLDVTDIELARAAEARATERLQDAIEALPAGFELYDADDRLVLSNSVMKCMYPRVADLLDRQPTFDELVRANHARGGLPIADADLDGWLAARQRQRRSGGEPRVHALADGTWVRTYERATREGGLVGVRIDVSELVRRENELQRVNAELDVANAELRRLADTDALTGIANRRRFEQALAEAWSRGGALALLLIDIDHFKRFNDHHGHPAGDACLRRVAAVLTAVLRGPSDLAARLGGEEFAVLLPGEGVAGARAAAQRCLDLLADAAIAHDDSPLGDHVSFSIGIAVRSSGDANAEALIDGADAALYDAKRAGRARYELHAAP